MLFRTQSPPVRRDGGSDGRARTACYGVTDVSGNELKPAEVVRRGDNDPGLVDRRQHLQ